MPHEHLQRKTAFIRSKLCSGFQSPAAARRAQDERDTFSSELKSLETSDVIEDPQTITEYNSLKAKVIELQDTLNNSSSLTNEEIEQLKSEKLKLEDKITDLNSTNIDLENRVSELELDKIQLEGELQRAQDDKSKDIQIEELTTEIRSIQDEIDRNKVEIARLTGDISEKDGKIVQLETKVSDNNFAIQHYTDLLATATDKLTSTHYLESQVEFLTEANTSLEQTLAMVQTELDESQENLERARNDADKMRI